MNRETLYEAVTNINDGFIEEADPDKGSGFMPRIRRLRPVLSLAAVFAVVLGLTALAAHTGLFSMKSTETAPAAESSMGFAMRAEENTADFAVSFAEEAPAAAPQMDRADEETKIIESFEADTPASEDNYGVVNDVQITEQKTEHTDMTDEAGTDNIPQEGLGEEFQDVLGLLPDGYSVSVTQNGLVYTIVNQAVDVIPDGFTVAGTLSNQSGAKFYIETNVLSGADVYASQSDLSSIYVDWNGVLIRFAR